MLKCFIFWTCSSFTTWTTSPFFSCSSNTALYNPADCFPPRLGQWTDVCWKTHAELAGFPWARTCVCVWTQWQTQRSSLLFMWLLRSTYTASTAEQLSQGLETTKGKQHWHNPHRHYACTYTFLSILSVHLYLPDATVTPNKVVGVPVSPTCNLGKEKEGKEKIMKMTAFVTLHLRTERSFLQNKCQEVITKEIEDFAWQKHS